MMKLEVGKYYRNRNGEKVGPLKPSESGDPVGYYIKGYGLIRPDGRFGYGKQEFPENLHLIAEWTDEPEDQPTGTQRAPDTPKIWRDMTPEEKGALLLAHHEGKVVEVFGGNGWWAPCSVGRYQSSAYRIKPEPKRETVTLYAGHPDPDCDPMPIGTIDLIDGEIVPVSICLDEV